MSLLMAGYQTIIATFCLYSVSSTIISSQLAIFFSAARCSPSITPHIALCYPFTVIRFITVVVRLFASMYLDSINFQTTIVASSY